MRTFFLWLLVLCFSYVRFHAQPPYLVLKANSPTTYIIEDGKDSISWNLDPGLKPDIYTLTKTVKKRQIDFVSDVMSISFTMTPGTQKEVVVLYGKDSCFTRFICPSLINHQHLVPEVHDTLPFRLTAYNNLVIPVVVDEKDTLFLKFDSGSTGFRLTKSKLQEQPHLGQGSRHSLRIGKTMFRNCKFIQVAVSGQETEGRFGWDVLDGYLLELDYDQNRMILHSQLNQIPKGFQRFPMGYHGGLLTIDAKLKQSGKSASGNMLLDNGYQKALFVDARTAAAWKLPMESMQVLNQSVLLNGAGDSIVVKTVLLESFSVGKLKLFHVPLQITEGENPAGMNIAFMGNELMKRFNMILDFQQHRVYLRPNSLMEEPYKDLEQKG